MTPEAPEAPEAPAATEEASLEAAPMMPGALLETARRAQSVSQVRIYLGDKGQARKMAVYHNDEGKVPTPVLALAKERFPKAKVKKFEAEFYEDVGLVYEVELSTPEGASMELSAFADGRLYYVETQMEVASLPEPLRQATMEAVPKGTIEEIDRKKGPTMDITQVRVKPATGQAQHYLAFDAQGKLVRHSLRYPAFVEVPAP